MDKLEILTGQTKTLEDITCYILQVFSGIDFSNKNRLTYKRGESYLYATYREAIKSFYFFLKELEIELELARENKRTEDQRDMMLYRYLYKAIDTSYATALEEAEGDVSIELFSSTFVTTLTKQDSYKGDIKLAMSLATIASTVTTYLRRKVESSGHNSKEFMRYYNNNIIISIIAVYSLSQERFTQEQRDIMEANEVMSKDIKAGVAWQILEQYFPLGYLAIEIKNWIDNTKVMY